MHTNFEKEDRKKTLYFSSNKSKRYAYKTITILEIFTIFNGMLT